MPAFEVIGDCREMDAIILKRTRFIFGRGGGIRGGQKIFKYHVYIVVLVVWLVRGDVIPDLVDYLSAGTLLTLILL